MSEENGSLSQEPSLKLSSSLQDPSTRVDASAVKTNSVPFTVVQIGTSGALPAIDDNSMLDLIDRLRLLNYEQQFCTSNAKTSHCFKPLTDSFFLFASENPTAQFFYFISLAVWLMRECGHQISADTVPNQFDDPTTSSTFIMVEMKKMDFPVRDLAPNRIRTGYGDVVLLLLLMLSDRALQRKGFQFPISLSSDLDYPPPITSRAEEEATIREMVEDDGDRRRLFGAAATDTKKSGRGIRDDIDNDGDTESEEEYFEQRETAHQTWKSSTDPGSDALVVDASCIPAEEWFVEAERLAPQLAFTPEDEVPTWRLHLGMTRELLQSIETTTPTITQTLQRTVEEIRKVLDQIARREQTLSVQFSDMVESYRTQWREYDTIRKRCSKVHASVSEASTSLNKLSEELDSVKNQIHEREMNLSDTTPLMQIKEAVSRMKSEIKEMGLRIGVLQHTVLHYSQKQSRESTGVPIQPQDSALLLGLADP